MNRPNAVASRARISVAFLGLGIAAACGDPTATDPASQEVVVRAYLYAGQPVDDIRLTYTAPIGTPDSLINSASPPINNATVTLIRDGVRFPLVKASGDSGYYRYAGTNLTVREGDVFDLEASVSGTALSARTQVPVRPSGARVSAATLLIPVFTGGPGGLGGGGRPDPTQFTLQVRWTKTAGALYYVTLENTETAPTVISTGLPAGLNFRRVRIFSPTAADSFPVNALSLEYYGRYRVRVWRVNEEYAQLYATRQQDSRDLNEPLTNIRGGLGVFSAFAADTTSFVAVKP